MPDSQGSLEDIQINMHTESSDRASGQRANQTQALPTQINPERIEKSWYERICPCLHYMALAPYFDVSTEDIKARFRASLMPYNQKFIMEYQKKPDLYGPFWLIWTLVVVITISGNLNKY